MTPQGLNDLLHEADAVCRSGARERARHRRRKGQQQDEHRRGALDRMIARTLEVGRKFRAAEAEARRLGLTELHDELREAAAHVQQERRQLRKMQDRTR